MPTFAYEARDSAGVRVAGTVDAASEMAALSDLQGRGLLPTSVTEQRAARVRGVGARALSSQILDGRASSLAASETGAGASTGFRKKN